MSGEKHFRLRAAGFWFSVSVLGFSVSRSLGLSVSRPDVVWPLPLQLQLHSARKAEALPAPPRSMRIKYIFNKYKSVIVSASESESGSGGEILDP